MQYLYAAGVERLALIVRERVHTIANTYAQSRLEVYYENITMRIT